MRSLKTWSSGTVEDPASRESEVVGYALKMTGKNTEFRGQNSEWRGGRFAPTHFKNRPSRRPIPYSDS